MNWPRTCCCGHSYTIHSSQVYDPLTSDEATAGICYATRECDCLGFLRETYRREWTAQQMALALTATKVNYHKL